MMVKSEKFHHNTKRRVNRSFGWSSAWYEKVTIFPVLSNAEERWMEDLLLQLLGVQEMQAHPEMFWFVENLGKISTQIRQKCFDILPIRMKLYLLFLEFINKGEFCQRKHISKAFYKISKLVAITSCFVLWEFMSNWLTWKFGQKRYFIYVLRKFHTV